MQISIRNKLLFLGVVSVLAFAAIVAKTYETNKTLEELNGQEVNNTANKILSDRWKAKTLQLVLDYHKESAEVDGKIDKEVMDEITDLADYMPDYPDRFLGKHVGYVKVDSMKKGIELSNKIVKAVKEDLPKMIAAHASHEELAKHSEELNKNVTELVAIEDELDGAVKGALDDVADQVTPLLQSANKQLKIVAGIALAIMLPIMGIIGFSIIRPLKYMALDINSLAQGDVNTELRGKGRSDELGTVIAALLNLQQATVDRVQAENAEQEKRKVEEDAIKKNAMQQVANDLERDVGSIVSAVSNSAEQMSESANILSSATEETRAQAESVSSSSVQATQNVTNVASSTEELSASIAEISKQIQTVTTQTRGAVEQANTATSVMSELQTAASSISDVVGLIEGIAGQINLLALNATIESARAGEAGKGFAVVASEVKNLAGQTTKATADIAEKINGVLASVNKNAESIKSITSSIATIDSVATTIAGAVEEQRAATQEIAQNVSKTSEQVKSVGENIDGISKATSETGRLSVSVLENAQELKNESTKLSESVTNFVNMIRSA